MGVFVPAPDACQVEIVSLLGIKTLENRLWFSYDTPPWTPAALQGLTDGVAAWWTGMVLPYLSQDLFTGFVQARDWTSSATPVVATTIVDAAGGVAAESSSANVAVVVPFKWPLGFREKRNKNYVAGVPEQEIQLNTPSTAIRLVLFEAYSALIDAARDFYPELTWRWRVASAYANGVPRSEQLLRSSQGTYMPKKYILGQRRKRLP